jgi:hypothetical protein
MFPVPDFLTANERTLILSDVAALMGDTQISRPVTYRAFQSQSFTPSTGTYTPTYTDTAVRMVRNELSSQEVEASRGLYQQGDIRFLAERATFLADPGKEDVIVDNGATFNLIAWDSDPLSAFWRIIARQVA